MGFNVGLILIAVLNVAACSILGIAHSWKLGLVVVFGGLPPLLLAGWLKIRLDMRMDHISSKNGSTSASIASEAITAIRTVSSLAIEERVLARYTAELDQAVAGTVKPLTWVMVCFALTQSIEYWFMALGFWFVTLLRQSARMYTSNPIQVRLPVACLQRNLHVQLLRSLHGRLLLRPGYRPNVSILDESVSLFMGEDQALTMTRHYQGQECGKLHVLALGIATNRAGDGSKPRQCPQVRRAH
jgi:ABC-type multidrug transport system fused ATPase/permease subunit